MNVAELVVVEIEKKEKDGNKRAMEVMKVKMKEHTEM